MISQRQLEPDELLKLAGVPRLSSTCYTRMFPRLPAQGATNPRLEQGLIELGSKMIAAPTDRPDSEDPPPMQGYTYFDQFIDHDLTLDLTPLDAATPNVERTRNFRTPFLDLDHIYGGGPNLSPFHREIQTKQEVRLPVRTLLRGARVKLRSGQRAAKKIAREQPGIPIISDDEIAHGPHEKTLTKYGFDKDTPLWYYVLKEAELLQKGARLGPIGSRIVANILTRALVADAKCYVRVNPNWTPSLPARDSDPRMFVMADLLRFAAGITHA